LVPLYRAVQEALTNIRKHARASKVLLRLRYEDGALELLVQDNGRGTAANGVGFGLVGCASASNCWAAMPGTVRLSRAAIA
jgi:signal transduction histidine kinase